MSRRPPPPDDDLETRLDDEPDEQATAAHPDSGIVAELRAKLSNGKISSLPLYSLSDRMVVGRGKGCDWQIEDGSLSRQHAELKWTGRELTVEDMGSQNGTRVDGKPARGAVAVAPGATILLGTVPILFQVRAELADEIAGGDPDATRLTKAPPERIPDTRTDIPLDGAAASPFAPHSEPQVFRPTQHTALPEDITQPWDPRAALVRAPERGVSDALLERLRDQWRENRRPFVLGAATLYLLIVVGVWEWYDRKKAREAEEEAAARMVARAAAAKEAGPIVTPLAPANDPTLTPVAAGEREVVLGAAISDYDQGHLREALRGFRRLALDEHDEVSKFMVGLLETKLQNATAPALPPAAGTPAPSATPPATTPAAAPNKPKEPGK